MTNQHLSTNTTPLMLTKNFNQLKSEVQKHIAADQVIQGEYWDSHNAAYLETEYGIPLMLTKIADTIFQELPDGKHFKVFGDFPNAVSTDKIEFFGAFPDAVAMDGKDLSLVSWKFLKTILEELPEQTPGVKTVNEGISKLAAGGSWDKDAARAAASTARDTYWAATAAAWDANTAAAWAAAHTAHAAARAAWVAAWDAAAARDAAAAARDADLNAAWAAKWAARADDGVPGSGVSTERQSQILLQLIKEAPVMQQEES